MIAQRRLRLPRARLRGIYPLFKSFSLCCGRRYVHIDDINTKY
jgi:hypothetical protein